MKAAPSSTLETFYQGLPVLVLGDTGFKGAWLCEWLLAMGATVHGAGLPPDSRPALFDVLELGARLVHDDIDLRDRQRLRRLVRQVRPAVVFHLAAQSLVRRSYEDPLTTFDTNVTGTLNLLDALRAARYTGRHPCAVVVVTSDKCYRNDETGRAFAEQDALGGNDPYSASKAMTELLVGSWRQSFCSPARGLPAIRLATARAGNVLGGGDRARDRIAVDCVRALLSGQAPVVRNPGARRPWQHVLEPLSGYLMLAQRLHAEGGRFASAWNFGPGPAGERTVGELCSAFVDAFRGAAWLHRPSASAHEARVLRLAIDKAEHHLGWRPVWSFDRMVEHTVAWYRTAVACGHDPDTMRACTRAQIAAFVHARISAATASPPADLSGVR